VRVHFADGRREDGALLVGADGVRSAVRQALLGEVPPLYAGYAVLSSVAPHAAIWPERDRPRKLRLMDC
jgi:2-polyprenyl-6-methoxyphenol hydroxylase-like FAD-dependent oxidoreductase